jgi:putative membrane protein
MQEAAQSPAKRAAISLAITIAASVAIIVLLGDAAYLWIKAIHVIAVISWMAGMLYLPRLFIYHCDSEQGSKQSETFKIMEQRLLRIIINPAMIITWVLGLWLAWKGGWLAAPWLHAKFACVFALSAAHGYFSSAVRKFAADANDRSARHWRIMNEVPTVLMIAIIILVLVKPF